MVINTVTFGFILRGKIMHVILASCGNPDYYQDPDEPMYGCEENSKRNVSSLVEASMECRKFIERNDLGSGNWAGGEIFDGNKQVARISYNGSVLKP